MERGGLMPLEELKRRISKLQRGEISSRRRDAAEGRDRMSADLVRQFPDASVCSTERGEVFLCEAPLSDICSAASALVPRFSRSFAQARSLARTENLPRFLEPLADAQLETTALIDTETAGLHGRPLFMVGLLHFRGAEPIVSQYFARTYAEEAGLLELLSRLLPQVKLLVSFNGKAFDWPFVRDRMVYHRLNCQADFAHLDLLHPSRRRWRDQLPNCKLQTLERYLSGRWRSGDVPGEEIPQRYHDYVRDRDARLIAPIFHHNRLDLIAMMELVIALVDGEAPSSDASGGSETIAAGASSARG
jgi:uncharacterized protein YprB with RNaseH-like and TPR domain